MSVGGAGRRLLERAVARVGVTPYDALGAAVIVALVGAAYAPALGGGFVWDDVIFSEEPVILSPGGLWSIWFSPGDIRNEGHYWPIVYTTFWLEHKLWGLAAAPYHALNLVLHAVNALLVWRLARRLDIPGAWLLGAVFAVHPLHVESVAWIIERKDLLSGLFYLTAVLSWIGFAQKPSIGGYVRTLALFVAGMLSKSVVVTLPAALLVWHWWHAGRVTVADARRLLPFFAVGLAIAWADFDFYASRESVDLGYSLAERTLIAARALWFYAGKLVWPTDLAVIYPRWTIDAANPLAWAFVLAAATLAAGLWAARGRIGRGPLAGALYFAVTLAPVLGFIDYGYMQFSFVADRFQYLAGLGILAVLVGTVAEASARWPPVGRATVRVAAVLALAGLATLTWRQSGVYRDEIALFGHIVSLSPAARDAHLNLGSALLAAGRVEDGIEASRIAAEQRPETAGPLANLGRGLLAQERFDEAEAYLRQAIAKEPRHLSSLQNLAEVHRRRSRFERAEAAYRRVLEIDPRYALAHAGLGHMLGQTGRHEEGLEHMERVVSLRPDLSLVPALYVQMARSARELGRLDEAEAHVRQAIALRPDHQEPLREMAELRTAQGLGDEAREYRRRARDLVGDDPAALHTFAEALRKEQRLDDALGAYREAILHSPDFAPAHAGLGLALYQAKRHVEAVESMRRALELDADLSVAASLRLFSGHALRELGRAQAAEEEYEAALAIDPLYADALDHLAMAHFGQRRYEEALALYRRLVEVNSDSAVIHSNLGAVLHHLGRNEEALASIERALTLDPDLELARVGRREVLNALGRAPDAR